MKKRKAGGEELLPSRLGRGGGNVHHWERRNGNRKRGYVMEDLVTELTDMTFLDWSQRKMSPGTPGCFLKAYEEKKNRRIYYKLSNYDSYRGVFGHECINELIVSRVMNILKIPHLQYRLIHAELCIEKKRIETWICASENFREPDEQKLGFDVLYDLKKNEDESPLEFAVRCGWEQYIYQMFLIDYLVANRDRHGGNLEVLRKSDEEMRMAPLFDQGVSLLFSTYGDEKQIEEFDVLRDFPVNNFIGSRSLEYNLSLIPSGYNLKTAGLSESDREYIFDGLDMILTRAHAAKIWRMIWERWCRYEAIRGERRTLWE